MMMSTDLGDDMVKLVRWWIVFTKRDQERTIAQGEDIVNYRTSGDQWAGQVMVREFQKLDPATRATLAAEPRYVKFHYEVLSRWPQESGHYERRLVEAVEGIRRALEGGGG
ncbi:MAG: hypothetical protein FJW39_15665 [Acidobacteria bacterium]|nr:hypothetical protein [Acidobacteriota bacterium]